MNKIRLIALFAQFFLFTLVMASGQNPKETALPAPNPPVSVNSSTSQCDTRNLTEKVPATADNVIATAETHIHAVEGIAEFLATLLGIAGAASIYSTWRYSGKMEYLQTRLRALNGTRKRISGNILALQNKGDEFGGVLASLESRLSEGQQALDLQAGKTRALSQEIDELQKRETVLQLLAETVQNATLATSTLSDTTRLDALNYLSQVKHPVGVVPQLDVLRNCANAVLLRCAAAYGLGRCSEDSDLRGHYTCIKDGFREVLENLETPLKLAEEVIKAVCRYGPAFDDLKPLFERWEQCRERDDTISGS